MAVKADGDSGMESLSSDANTPERVPESVPAICDGNEDDEDDETLGERLFGLTEMFPDPIRNLTGAVISGIKKTVVASYGFSRQATWVLCSSSLLLFAPVMFEVERSNTQEALRRDQQQVLLGPNATGVPPPR